jgi:hypothetical protein
MATDLENLIALRDSLGPKRVKTKETEIERDSLRELLIANQQLNVTQPNFTSIHFTKVSPKYGCDCNNQFNQELVQDENCE